MQLHVENLDKNGSEWKGLCPFCLGGVSREEKFYIDLEYGVSVCHRAVKCGWKGNAVTFISELLDVSYEEAVEHLNGGALDSLNEAQAMLELMSNEEVYEEPPNEAWIEGSRPIADLSRKEYDGIKSWLERRGYDPDDFIASHELWVPPYGLYDGRVLFKVTSGRIKGYQLYDYTGLKSRKTINPKHEFLSRTLYKYDDWRSSEEPILIHEGIFDVARSMQRGFNATCVFGTNLSETQEYLLSSCAARAIFVCLDGDTKTEDIKRDKAWAMARALAEIKETYLVRLPMKEDPDSVKKEVLHACIERASRVKSVEEWRYETLRTF